MELQVVFSQDMTEYSNYNMDKLCELLLIKNMSYQIDDFTSHVHLNFVVVNGGKQNHLDQP